MNINNRREKLIQRLRDKEHRDAFVEAQIDIGIPFQIRVLREQRNETQAGLSARTGMAQAWISKLENPNYSGFSLATLKKIASAFDVGLVVRFVPISQLVEWELHLSNESLLVPSFDNDPYFQEPTAETQANGKQCRTEGKRGNLFFLSPPKRHKSITDTGIGGQPSQGPSYLNSQEKNRASALS